MTPATTRPERVRDAVIGVVLLAFALAIWFVLIPDFAGGHGEHVIVAEIAAILVGVLAVLLLVLAAYGIPSAANVDEDDPFLEVGAGREPPKLFVLGLIWGLYVLGLNFVGFYVAGLLAVGTSIALLGVRRPVILLPCTAGAVLGCYLVFELGFKLALPQGRWVTALVATGS